LAKALDVAVVFLDVTSPSPLPADGVALTVVNVRVTTPNDLFSQIYVAEIRVLFNPPVQKTVRSVPRNGHKRRKLPMNGQNGRRKGASKDGKKTKSTGNPGEEEDEVEVVKYAAEVLKEMGFPGVALLSSTAFALDGTEVVWHIDESP
jgi:hypothetical protein